MRCRLSATKAGGERCHLGDQRPADVLASNHMVDVVPDSEHRYQDDEPEESGVPAMHQCLTVRVVGTGASRSCRFELIGNLPGATSSCRSPGPSRPRSLSCRSRLSRAIGRSGDCAAHPAGSEVLPKPAAGPRSRPPPLRSCPSCERSNARRRLRPGIPEARARPRVRTGTNPPISRSGSGPTAVSTTTPSATANPAMRRPSKRAAIQRSRRFQDSWHREVVHVVPGWGLTV